MARSPDRPTTRPPGERIWSRMIGAGRTDPTRVYARENWQRQGVVILRYWVDGKKTEHTTNVYLRTATGRVDPKQARIALALAQAKHEELIAPRAAPDVPAPPLTISEAEALLVDPATGCYPPPHTAHHRETLRLLRFAVRVWTPTRAWDTLKRADWTTLGRKAVDAFVERQADPKGRKHAKSRNNARDKGGWDTAVKTVSRVLTVARWLVDHEHVEASAAVLPKEWRSELQAYWEQQMAAPVPKPSQPRHTLAEMRRILTAMRDVDPRGFLVLALGADLRAGQVRRVRRSDVVLDATEMAPHGHVTIAGAGKKGGAVVFLTKGQRAALDAALGAGGYLEHYERAYRDGRLANYALFPGGKLRSIIGGSWQTAQHVPPFAPLPDALEPPSGIYRERRQRPTGIIGRKSMNEWMHEAEKRAKVAHIRGRSYYGLRRVDVDETMDRTTDMRVIQHKAGWSDSKMALTVYADRESQQARRKAMEIRADIRGEPTT